MYTSASIILNYFHDCGKGATVRATEGQPVIFEIVIALIIFFVILPLVIGAALEAFCGLIAFIFEKPKDSVITAAIILGILALASYAKH